MTLLVGSLFSGVGGMDLGLELAGLRTAWQCEIDPWRRAVLAQHWPDIPRYDDVTTLVSAADLPPVDVICGGFPCQDASVANPTGRGLAGARTGLWFRMLEIIQAVRPVGVIGENVPGLLRRGLDVACRGLQDAGYEVEATRLRASDLGFSHRRERVVIVAILADAHAGRPRARAGGAGESPGWPTPDGRCAPGVAHTVGGRPPQGFGPGDLAGAEREAPEVRDAPWRSSPSALADTRREPGQRDGEPGDLRGAPGGAEGAGQERERLRDAARGGGAPGMADADGARQPQPSGGLANERGWAGDRGADARAMGHGHGQGQPQRQGVGGDPCPQQPPAVGAGGRLAEPGLGGAPDGLPAWVDRRCAGRGEAQYPEEPPRTAPRRRGDGAAQRVSGLGNAFVPLCAYVAGMRLLERLNMEKSCLTP